LRTDFRRMRSSLLSFVAVFVLVAGCSGGNRAAQTAPSAPVNLSNPTGFPLYAGSHILVAKAYKQVVNANNTSGNGVLAQGNGTYSGHEVIASAPAAFSALQTWLHDSYAKPPAGYQKSTEADLNSSSETARTLGLDGRGFQTAQNGQKSTLLVVVMDPSKVTGRLGPALALIRRYRDMPQFMRGPIDQKVKEQTGFSVSEMLQPDSPMGLALDALNEFSHNNQRAILMIDAHKE
jgi:hypothetical protein